MLSRPTQYAILAMVYLARQPEGRLVPVAEVGEEADVPKPFLVKVLGSLSRRGMVSTRRGPNGGVSLGRAPGAITLGEIVETFEGPLAGNRCYLGLEECSEVNPCPAHAQWAKVRGEMERTLYRRTLSDLVGKAARGAKGTRRVARRR